MERNGREMEEEIVDIPKKKHAGRKSSCPGDKIIADLYRNHTAKEIAAIYHVSYGTVKYWIACIRRRAKEAQMME